MTDEQTWDNQEWVYSAKKILEWIAVVPKEQPLMFLVRHSHRETLQNHDEMVSGGLTELGKKMSLELGKRIPRSGKMHIYTSFIPRCFETAEAIAEGFTLQGGEVIDIDPLPSLVGPQVVEEEVWRNLHPDGRNIVDFVNIWVDGGFGKENIMHVHVTHDLAMMSAKRILLKRPLVPEDREPYLGGLGVTNTGSKMVLNIAGKSSPLILE
jgi:hypothetical protein